jgi:hypothetical protein
MKLKSKSLSVMSRKIYLHLDEMGLIDRRNYWKRDDAEQKRIEKAERQKNDSKLRRLLKIPHKPK